MKLLVDHGAYGNLGDTAMIEGVVLRLKSILPEAEIFVVDSQSLKTVIWDFPGVFRQKEYNEYIVKSFFMNIFAGVPFFRRYRNCWRKVSRKITLWSLGRFFPAGSLSIANYSKTENKSIKLSEFCEQFDALHIVGGGNLTDTFLEELFKKSCLLLTFAEQDKPIVLTGQQIGPFKSNILKKALCRVLRKSNFVGLREPIDSLSFCQKAHIDAKQFEVMGDDSFGLSPADDELILNLLDQYGLKENEFLAFNVRIAFYALEQKRHLQQIAVILDKIGIYFQMPIVIVPIALNPGDSDIVSGKELAKLVRSAQILVMENNNLTPGLVKGILGKAFGVVGVSYHFCTFALSQGVPAVCIHDGDYYLQKARGLCGFWKDGRLALPLNETSTNQAVNHIVQLFEDGVFREKLSLEAKKSKELWYNIFDKQVKSYFS